MRLTAGLAFVGMVFVSGVGASAAVLEVDPTVPDVLATDGQCSLREAITNANDDAATWPDCPTGTGPDRVEIGAGAHYPSTAILVVGELDVVGAGADTTVIDAGSFRVEPGATARIARLTISGAVGYGISNAGDLTVDEAVIEGTISYCPRGHCTWPGAIHNEGGTVTVVRSALIDNEIGILVAAGSCVARNATLAGNAFQIMTYLGATSSVVHATIDGGTVLGAEISGSIVVGTCGWATSLGYNLSDQPCAWLTEPTDQSAGPIFLGELTEDPVPVIPVYGGSVAIDAVPAGECAASEDQLGTPRPAGAGCDIGAYERVPPQVPGSRCGLGFEAVPILLALLHGRNAYARYPRRRPR